MQRRESPLAVEAAASLALACLVVRGAPGSWLTRLLRRGPSAFRATAAGSPDPVLRMVERVARVLPLSPRCLEQALAARWMLARRGHASTLVIGVRHPFAAHAWLEIDGRVVGQRPEAHGFQRMWAP